MKYKCLSMPRKRNYNCFPCYGLGQRRMLTPVLRKPFCTHRNKERWSDLTKSHLHPRCPGPSHHGLGMTHKGNEQNKSHSIQWVQGNVGGINIYNDKQPASLGARLHNHKQLLVSMDVYMKSTVMTGNSQWALNACQAKFSVTYISCPASHSQQLRGRKLLFTFCGYCSWDKMWVVCNTAALVRRAKVIWACSGSGACVCIVCMCVVHMHLCGNLHQHGVCTGMGTRGWQQASSHSCYSTWFFEAVSPWVWSSSIQPMSSRHQLVSAPRDLG